MKISLTLIAGLAIASVAGTAAFSDAHADKAALAAVKARQANMQLYSFNLGLLGGMAKGEIEYDAAMAQGAASNLAKLTTLDQSRYWAPGTSTDELGDATRALPKIWQAGSKAGEIGKMLAEAAAAMDGAAGSGIDGVRGAIGPIGKACGACHDDYRKPQ